MHAKHFVPHNTYALSHDFNGVRGRARVLRRSAPYPRRKSCKAGSEVRVRVILRRHAGNLNAFFCDENSQSERQTADQNTLNLVCERANGMRVACKTSFTVETTSSKDMSTLTVRGLVYIPAPGCIAGTDGSPPHHGAGMV